MHIPLFTFHFLGRVIVRVRYGINYAQKQRLGGKKTTRCCSIQFYKQNETVHGKRGRNLAICFFHIKIFFFFFLQHFSYMCVCFVGNVAVSA